MYAEHWEKLKPLQIHMMAIYLIMRIVWEVRIGSHSNIVHALLTSLHRMIDNVGLLGDDQSGMELTVSTRETAANNPFIRSQQYIFIRPVSPRPP